MNSKKKRFAGSGLFLTEFFFSKVPAIYTGKSLVRSQLVSLEFFIDIKSFWSHYGTGADSGSNLNEYQELSIGVKAAGA